MLGYIALAIAFMVLIDYRTKSKSESNNEYITRYLFYVNMICGLFLIIYEYLIYMATGELNIAAVILGFIATTVGILLREKLKKYGEDHE